MPKAIDISGQRFGRLTVIKREGSRNGKALWSLDCDCGTKGYLATQNALSRAWTQSCGCLREEFLHMRGGLRRATTNTKEMPHVEVSYPVPEIIYPGKSAEFNAAMRRRYQFRWERVEREVRKIKRGEWKEPELVPFVPRDQDGRRIERLDLLKLAVEKRKALRAHAKVHTPDVPASFIIGASLADRVRVLTDEEWARL